MMERGRLLHSFATYGGKHGGTEGRWRGKDGKPAYKIAALLELDLDSLAGRAGFQMLADSFQVCLVCIFRAVYS
jgi:hypothetical protein